MSQTSASPDEILAEVLGPVLEEQAAEETELAGTVPIFILVGASLTNATSKWKISASIEPKWTRHWAVRVGEYIWEMFKDQDDNVSVKKRRWVGNERRFTKTYKVGKTDWNEADIHRRAGEIIRDRPKYSVLENSCQTFVIALYNEIKLGTKLPLTLVELVFKLATDPKGTVKAIGEANQRPPTIKEALIQPVSFVEDSYNAYLVVNKALSRFQALGAEVKEKVSEE